MSMQAGGRFDHQKRLPRRGGSKPCRPSRNRFQPIRGHGTLVYLVNKLTNGPRIGQVLLMLRNESRAVVSAVGRPATRPIGRTGPSRTPHRSSHAAAPQTAAPTELASARLRAGLRAQDPAVAGLLWRCFAPTIFRLLRRGMGPGTPVDAAVQAVLLSVFHRGRRLGPNADLAGFVLRTTIRVMHMELRRRTFGWFRSAWRGAVAREVRSGDRSDEDGLVRFYRILDRLGAADRIAFVLHKIEGLDVREVAVAMGISARRTSVRLRRSIHEVAAGIAGDPVLRRLPISGRGSS
jgi:DNA-directed RNA polymerase specialized sigma24 family protein